MVIEYGCTLHGVCSRGVKFLYNTDDNTITNVTFVGGCNGNSKAVSLLVDGMTAEDVISKLEHVECGSKGTSCAAEFVKGIKELMDDIKNKEFLNSGDVKLNF